MSNRPDTSQKARAADDGAAAGRIHPAAARVGPAAAGGQWTAVINAAAAAVDSAADASGDTADARGGEPDIRPPGTDPTPKGTSARASRANIPVAEPDNDKAPRSLLTAGPHAECARDDSNVRPLAPEASALSS